MLTYTPTSAISSPRFVIRAPLRACLGGVEPVRSCVSVLFPIFPWCALCPRSAPLVDPHMYPPCSPPARRANQVCCIKDAEVLVCILRGM